MSLAARSKEPELRYNLRTLRGCPLGVLLFGRARRIAANIATLPVSVAVRVTLFSSIGLSPQ